MFQKKKISAIIVLLIYIGLCLACFIFPKQSYSYEERRALAKFPKLEGKTIADGSFMRDFETYGLDQFPGRNLFRKGKALWETKALEKLDTNGYYSSQGYLSKLEYPYAPKQVEHALERFAYLYHTYLEQANCQVYMTVIPDKNFFLAKESERLYLDYDAFVQQVKDGTTYANYLDVFPFVSLEGYYRTDTHLKQKGMLPMADFLLEQMTGEGTKAEYEAVALDNPFYGVYYGQAALPAKPDTLEYLTNNTLQQCVVTSFSTGKPESANLYNMEKAKGKDPYEMFLEGAVPLITIENPTAKQDRTLYLFRDSFGSSLAPLLVEGYSKIVLIDIRYLSSDKVGQFVEFQDGDVLFAYSTLLLNSSMVLK